jgi:hypothetical protein
MSNFLGYVDVATHCELIQLGEDVYHLNQEKITVANTY